MIVVDSFWIRDAGAIAEKKVRSPKDFNFVFGVSTTKNPLLIVTIFLAGIDLKFLLFCTI